MAAIACVLAATTAGGCTSHGATQNDASSSEGGGGSDGDDASAADAPAPDAGSGDGGLWPCAPPADPTQPHPTLAATGCMDTLAITRFASGAYGYEINSPLWSDLADKERAFVLPPGGKIHVADCAAQPNGCLDAADEGKWVFPAGTTLLKSFGFDGKLVETRLLVALPDGTWVGYSYQWNEGQTGATLVASAGASASFNTGSRTVDWTYPGRRDCTECHTRSAGWTLGPETAQMNRVPITAALGTGNQNRQARGGGPVRQRARQTLQSCAGDAVRGATRRPARVCDRDRASPLLPSRELRLLPSAGRPVQQRRFSATAPLSNTPVSATRCPPRGHKASRTRRT